MLQEFIFVAFHIVAYFVVYTLTSCAGCWNGHTISHDDDCKDRFWHYDFIETELKELNNFVNHPRGRAELDYNRGLSLVRQQTMVRRQAEEDAVVVAEGKEK